MVRVARWISTAAGRWWPRWSAMLGGFHGGVPMAMQTGTPSFAREHTLRMATNGLLWGLRRMNAALPSCVFPQFTEIREAGCDHFPAVKGWVSPFRVSATTARVPIAAELPAAGRRPLRSFLFASVVLHFEYRIDRQSTPNPASPSCTLAESSPFLVAAQPRYDITNA